MDNRRQTTYGVNESSPRSFWGIPVLWSLLILILPIHTFAVLDSSAIIAYEKKIDDHSSRAAELKKKISESKKELKRLKAQENKNLTQLNEIEANIDLTASLIEELSATEDSLTNDMETARTAVDSIGVELDKRQQIMEDRLRQIYKTGDVTMLSILLGSSSPTEVIHKIRYARDLNRYDREILAQIADDKLRRNTEIAILKIQKNYFTELREEKSQESEQLRSQIEDRRSLLTSIQNEKEQWESTLQELAETERKIQSKILSYIKKRDEVSEALANSFIDLKGKMRWPVAGEIVSTYGKQKHPVHGTVITNKGIGIAGTIGTPVKVVAPGVVEYVGRLPGYGRVMIVNHYGGYMTIYAHLGSTSVEKGAKVTAGMKLGTVGESGSLEGPSLHFEIREGADTRDPLSWLGKRHI